MDSSEASTSGSRHGACDNDQAPFFSFPVWLSSCDTFRTPSLYSKPLAKLTSVPPISTSIDCGGAAPFVTPAAQTLSLAVAIDCATGLPEPLPVAETVKLPAPATGFAGVAMKFVMR